MNIWGFAPLKSRASRLRRSPLINHGHDTRTRPRRRAGSGLARGRDRARARRVRQLRPRRVADAREDLPAEPAERRLPRDAGARRGAGDAEVGHVVPGQSAPRPADRDGHRAGLRCRHRGAAGDAGRPRRDGAAHRRRGSGRRPGAGPRGRAQRRPRRLRAARHVGRPLPRRCRVRARGVLRPGPGRRRRRRGGRRLGGRRPGRCARVRHRLHGHAGRRDRGRSVLSASRPAPEPARRRRPRKGRGDGGRDRARGGRGPGLLRRVGAGRPRRRADRRGGGRCGAPRGRRGAGRRLRGAGARTRHAGGDHVVRFDRARDPGPGDRARSPGGADGRAR